MPAVLNSVATQNLYVDALTVTFAAPRTGFSLNVFNAAVRYQLRVAAANTQNPRDLGDYEASEHDLPPSFNRFRSPEDEGFPPGARFTGIRLRSSAANTPALVTVM